jgi:hypothetical protein
MACHATLRLHSKIAPSRPSRMAVDWVARLDRLGQTPSELRHRQRMQRHRSLRRGCGLRRGSACSDSDGPERTWAGADMSSVTRHGIHGLVMWSDVRLRDYGDHGAASGSLFMIDRNWYSNPLPVLSLRPREDSV